MRNIRVWIGPLPSPVCQAHSLLTKMSLTFAIFVVVTITMLRFFYIVVWRSIREVNDNLLARIVFLESCLLSFFYSITRLETQVFISGYSWSLNSQINETQSIALMKPNYLTFLKQHKVHTLIVLACCLFLTQFIVTLG